MRPISCCKQDRRPENVFDRQLCDGGSGKDPVRDAIFSVGARNESRELSLMSALPVNAGAPGVLNAFSTSTAACHASSNRSAFGRMDRAESRRRAHPVAGQDHRRDEPRRQRASIVRSAIRLQGCAECSSGVLFRRFDCALSGRRLFCFPEPFTEFVQFGDLNK